MPEELTQKKLVMEFFERKPRQDIKHPEVVDWLTKEWLERKGKVFRDPDRAVRMLFQEGFLQKVAKGVYRYDPDYVKTRELEDFTQAQKEKILKRDNYRCVICGLGLADGVELQVDHIKAKDYGGKATIENGQTLCAQHNFKKKNYKQTETGKKMFIRLYEASKAIGDTDTQKFCAEVLEVFERNKVNGHIVWKK
ncbi:MAG: HNH endonuclease [Treponema sp.]|jgi:hypothetical protein|nr:HNH endonuclease [Treponema sp.]